LKTAKVLACCLLILPLEGPLFRPIPNCRAKSLPHFQESSANQALLLTGLRAGAELFREGRFSGAAGTFRRLAARGISNHDTSFPVRATTVRATPDLGGRLFSPHRNQTALTSFLDARCPAQSAGDASIVAGIDAHIASSYAETGDLEAAAHWIEGTEECLDRAPELREHLPGLLIQLATIRARQKRLPEALTLFRQGIDGADRAGDWNLYAEGWNRWGEELLKRGDLVGAEPALLEAYRVRKLQHLALDTSYRNLGRLRLEQGDLRSASMLLDHAVALAEGPQGQMPTWDLYHYRGRVRLAQGRLPEALNDLRAAVRLGWIWSWSAASDDAGEESCRDRLHSALIEAGNRMYLRTGDRAFLRETFEELEENRASSLRLLRAGRRGGLPADYREALLPLQRAEVKAVRNSSDPDQAAWATARAEAGRLEAWVGCRPAPAHGGLLERAQSALDRDTALLSFHLDDDISWMWAVDRGGIELYALRPRAAIALQVREAARSVRDDRPSAAEAGAALYGTLFGKMAARFRRKRRWLIALSEPESQRGGVPDGSIFNAPLAALVAAGGSHPTYLVQLHTIEVVPGVGWWLEAAGRPARPLTPLFVGIGDPIYNAADPRLTVHQKSFINTPGALKLFAAGLSLPRLVASGPELDVCARAWAGENTLLKGPAASGRNLQKELERNPAVVHFATHMLESPERPSDGAIALSLTEGGETEQLCSAEIAHWRIRSGLIVLNGCHSAAGEVLPGAGLLGLTRAWLAAGADNVVGSRWTTLDETGALFSALYRNLRTQPGSRPAQALRAAQLEMLRAGDWRARPRYWGAYFVMGDERIQ
jgi:tetratricopeptide (TPR) repeat protein